MITHVGFRVVRPGQALFKTLTQTQVMDALLEVASRRNVSVLTVHSSPISSIRVGDTMRDTTPQITFVMVVEAPITERLAEVIFTEATQDVEFDTVAITLRSSVKPQTDCLVLDAL